MFDELYKGLVLLGENPFPNKCDVCGRTFKNADEFILKTESCGQSGLHEAIDDNGTIIVELFRNCPCGSTLMRFFHNRRDITEENIKRREKFDKLIEILRKADIDDKTAQQELRKVVKGKYIRKSEFFFEKV